LYVLSFYRTQSRVVIGLLTGHNTLRRHLYIWDWVITPPVGSVVLRRKPKSTFFVSGLGFTQTCTSGLLIFGP
jgi:hypothetical protein